MSLAEPKPPYASVRLDTDELPGGPWVFARQVVEVPRAVEDGDLVAVVDASGRFVGHGLFNSASDIRVRLLARGRKTDLDRPHEFLLRKLASADRLRRKLLRLEEVTNAYRVVHAEGDDLSGLVVDRLGEVLVCEYHALGFWRLRDLLERALGELYPGLRVVHRAAKSALRPEGFPRSVDADGRLLSEPGEAAAVTIEEHGLRWRLEPGGGHKTGWFCDQRENRVRVAALARGRDVLDLCCNAGGFALQAAKHGARRVRGVDLDEVVLERAVAAAAENGLAVEFHHADAYPYLRALRESRGSRPEVVIVDPHKLIPSKHELELGLRRYSDLNALAFEVVAPGGLLASFSCSGSLGLPQFLGMLFQAARRAERRPRLLEVLGAGGDHPQRPEFPRSSYLKGALLAVD